MLCFTTLPMNIRRFHSELKNKSRLPIDSWCFYRPLLRVVQFLKKIYRNVLRNWQVPISNKIHDLKIETVYNNYKSNRNTDTKKSGRHDGRGNANLNRVSTHRWSWQSLLTSKDRSTLSLIWRNLPSGGWSIWSLGVYNRFLTHYFSLFYFLLLALPYYEANKPTYWP